MNWFPKLVYKNVALSVLNNNAEIINVIWTACQSKIATREHETKSIKKRHIQFKLMKNGQNKKGTTLSGNKRSHFLLKDLYTDMHNFSL